MLRSILRQRQSPPPALPTPAQPRAPREKTDTVAVSLKTARLVLTSSPRANLAIEGPVVVSDSTEGILIQERESTNEIDPVCHLDVPLGSLVDVQIEFGSLRVFNFQGNLRARLREGATRIDHAAGQFRVVSSEGAVAIEEVRGRVDALTTHGHIVVRSVDGDVQAVSDSGSLEFEDINGPLAARTTTGGIKAESLRGTSRLSTRTGEVRVQGCERQLTVRTQSGDVALEGSVMEHTTLETFKGRVEVRLGASTDARIDASARQGVVRSERLALAPGSGRRSVRSTVGSGRARLKLSTGMGVIEIFGPKPKRDPEQLV